MKKLRLLVLTAVLGTALFVASPALAWHAKDVKAKPVCNAESGVYYVQVEIVQSSQWPGATVESVTPSSFPGTTTGTQKVIVWVKWSNGERQEWKAYVTLDGTCGHTTPPPPPTPTQRNRQGWCAPVPVARPGQPNGTFLDLEVGAELVEPYKSMGLVPASVDSVTGAIGCFAKPPAVTPPAVAVTPKPPAAAPKPKPPVVKPKPKPDKPPVKKKKVKKVKKHAKPAKPVKTPADFTG